MRQIVIGKGQEGTFWGDGVLSVSIGVWVAHFYIFVRMQMLSARFGVS